MATTAPKNTNRLVRATSPYLLQHAHNPVDWYEWGAEALDRAKAEDKPIFLSIGYAACHWCHVMEHECFDLEEVADVLNKHFVCIKVDREERPDIDELYMTYTVEVTGQGGWPMSVWLGPDGTPFYAGTYFPKDNFLALLSRIAEVWTTDRQQLLAQNSNTRRFFAQWAQGEPPAEGVVPHDVVDTLAEGLAKHFDPQFGGLSGGSTNKFPPSMAMDVMLRAHLRRRNPEVLAAVTRTLDHMARGGIYDHIGGGICRYSTDVKWLVPHFEKMLYDQAMVSAIYLDAWQVTKNPLYAATAADICDYVIRDLRSPEGGLYSSRDADSEGMEGKFYIWTVDQVKAILGEADGAVFCEYYDITTSGNWFERFGHAPPGTKNIPRIQVPAGEFAAKHGLSPAAFEAKLAGWRETVRIARDRRVAPGLDDKILTAWNGLMIASLAKAAMVLDRPDYAAAAAQAADFVLSKLRRDGRLLRTYRAGDARLTAYLEDYAFFVEGLINLYEATHEPRWLVEAAALTDTLVQHYWDGERGGFFFTADDAEALLSRSKNPRDGAIPAGNSVAAMNLLRLGVLLDRPEYRERAEAVFRTFGALMQSSPWSFERMLCAVDFYHDKVAEVVILGDPAAADTNSLVRAVNRGYRPNKSVIVARPGDTAVPLAKGQTLVNGQPAAYVCFHQVCQRPVTGGEELEGLLFGQ